MSKSINQQRRTFLKASVLLPVAAGLSGVTMSAFASVASTFNKDAYAAESIKGALSALGGSSSMEVSDKIKITASSIAENGKVVPVAVTSTIDGAEQIAILVEKNPRPLSADLTMTKNSVPYISTRVKMGKTSDVYGAVKAGGKWYYAKKEIKVTLGGCGG